MSASLAGPAAAAEPYAARYAKLLEEHTAPVESAVGTVVDYPGLLREPANRDWQLLLRSLARAVSPQTRDEILSLWINAYNILAIDMVLRHYPVASIRDIGSLWRPVWKLDAGSVAGRSVSLHQIEHEILRPLGDPRIHAAIVCASTSCPSLWREPYTPSHIDAELDDAMRRWLASQEKGLEIDRERGRIRLSRIFKWFAEDFDPLGGVRPALRRYAPEDARDWLAADGRSAPIDYLRYDWRLNGAR